jgi:glucosamine--fructose-6-phosphate aminotransferase (isomerizing)
VSLEQSYLYREIHEQPTVLSALLERERPSIKRLASAIRARQVDYIVIAARGTSDNAGRYAQYLFGAMNQLMVALATPSLYSIYRRPPRFGNALVIGISQSGKSPDIVSVLAEARRQGAMTAAITNFPDSDLARQAEHVITLHAGEERSIAATKTYTASLAAIAALSAELAGDEQMQQALNAIPDHVASILALSPQIGALTERYRYMRRLRGAGSRLQLRHRFRVCAETQELTYTIAEPSPPPILCTARWR